MLGWILVIFLLLLVAGSIPTYPYSRGWGYGPSGVIGLLLVIVLLVVLTGRA